VQDGAQDYIVKGSANGDSVASAIQFAVLRTADRAKKNMTAPSDRAAAWWSS
jgi:hypothetical protein